MKKFCKPKEVSSFSDLRGLPLKKMLRMVRFTVFCFFLGLIQVMAVDSYSQQTRLSLNYQNETLENVLRAIEKESEFFFLYNRDLIDVDQMVSISADNQLIKGILDDLLKGTDIRYAIFDRQIVLSNKEVISEMAAQQKSVSGKVINSAGEPMPGVTVVVKGAMQGTVTDKNGNFSISNISERASLQFSFVGMKPQEIVVGNKTEVNVVMEEITIGVDEIIVVGYGSQNKSDLTGSIVSLSSEKLEGTMNKNLALSLQGTVPGLNITQSSFTPGSEQTLRIRGENSLSASNDPLIILDGIPFEGNLNEINTADVESASVLKDASSSAIYGARAANGVIIITTKKGQTGKTRVSYNGHYGVQSVQNKLDLLDDGDKYIAFIQEYHRFRNDGISLEPLNFLFSNEISQYNAGITTNWQDLVLRTAPEQEHIISMSGANDQTSYYSSLGMLDQEGVVENTGFKRYSLRTNIQHNLNDWLKIGSNVQLTYSDYSGITPSLSNAIRMSPYGKLKEDNGEYTFYPNYPETFYTNPFANRNATKDDIRRSSIVNLFAEISPSYIPGLSYRLSFGTYFYDRKDGEYYPSSSVSGAPTNGLAQTTHQNRFRWTVENLLTYQREFGKHSVKFTGLFSREGSKYETSYLEGKGFINDDNLYHYMASAEQKDITSSLTETALESLMARINYDFGKKYFLTLTARRDGYSGFGENNKYGFFPSAALGWSISNENFFRESSALDFINYLKFRVSYGVNGNMAVSPYKTLDSFVTVFTVFGDNENTVNGLRNSVIGNPDLKWEGTESYNIALDFAIVENRLSGTVEVYKSNSRDLLMQREIPIMNGYSSVWYNIGKTTNKGIEVLLNSVNIKKDDFEWNSSLNFSLNRDKIVALRGGNTDDIANNWFIGKPLRVYYDYNIIGVWQSDDDIANSHMPKAKPGYAKLEDVSLDGKLTTDDRKIIDSQLPDWIAGLTNNIIYKNWSLSVFINTVQGIHKPNSLLNPVSWLIKKNTNYLDIPYWTADRPSEKYVSPGYDANEQLGIGHGYYQNASFVRIKDVTLSYNLPKHLSEGIGLNNVKFYLSGKNLYTFTDWIGYDPEASESFGAYPSARIISAGVKIDF
jgi:TonB-dependent starch-binding outer membrane protein SusC